MMTKFKKDLIEHIELDLTTMCNAKCPLCFRNYKSFPDKYKIAFFRTADEIFAQLDSFSNLKSVDLVGQLSEPTTHPQLLDIVRRAKSRSLQIEMCTNGSLHDVSYWRSLAELMTDDDRIMFALCGSTQQVHESYRVGTALSKILDNAQSVRNVRPIDVAKCIMFKYNENDFMSASFKSIISKFSHTEFVTTLDQTKSTAYNDNFDKSMFAPTQHMSCLLNEADQLSAIPSRILCQSVIRHSVQIDPYGEVFPCWKFFERTIAQEWSQEYDKIASGDYMFCNHCKDVVMAFIQKKGIQL